MTIVASPRNPVRAGSGPVLKTAIPWRESLKRAIRSEAQLLETLELPSEFLGPAKTAAASFPLFVPREYVARMKKGDPNDPLLLQVLPLGIELASPAGFTADPVGDLAAAKSAGLLQKYDRRALLITTGACAIHCRYCFRRHFPYSEGPRSVEEWEPALDVIRGDESLDEVILSGGDPLTLVDGHLAELAQRLADIPHLKRLRVHTRLPIMIPQRVNDQLIAWLRGTRLAPIMVVHANHANEIDESVAEGLARLVDAGIPVLNQSVLLRGINDSAAALIDLSRTLVDLRVMPYYLHQLDRVQGAAHFEVPACRGLELIEEMRRHLPGYAVPRYVQEIAGDLHKRVLA
ncbi:MAG: EF-P beta-lysylation protein EpmB [Pirellulaceae bacterium]|nr:EF-P beta-lysylation protein EpmB [Pirellulaceae bacterium]